MICQSSNVARHRQHRLLTWMHLCRRMAAYLDDQYAMFCVTKEHFMVNDLSITMQNDHKIKQRIQNIRHLIKTQ